MKGAKEMGLLGMYVKTKKKGDVEVTYTSFNGKEEISIKGLKNEKLVDYMKENPEMFEF